MHKLVEIFEPDRMAVKLYFLLKKEGYTVEICPMWHPNYDMRNKYLAVFIRNGSSLTTDQLVMLQRLAFKHQCEVTLEVTDEYEIYYYAKQHRRFTEFISDQEWQVLLMELDLIPFEPIEE